MEGGGYIGRLSLLIIIMAVIFVISLFYTQLIIGVKRRKCDNAGCYMLVFLARCYSYFSATCITYIRCNTSADVLSGKRLVHFYMILKRTRQSSQFPHMRTDSPSYAQGDKSYSINLKHFLVQCRSFTITWYEDRTPPWVQSWNMPQSCLGPTLPCSQENSKHHTGIY